MHSKLGLLTTAIVTLALSACAYQERPSTDHSEDNLIGQNLSAVSSISTESDSDQSKIAMYDATVCRIHQFDLSTGTWERTFIPTIRGGTHKIMFEPSGNYVIDLVDAHLSIFNKNGRLQDPDLKFVGAPKNASFRPSLGYMVMQDDSKTAAILKIDSMGNVSGRASLGQIVYNDISMVAGDIDDSGQLVLAMSDGKIALIDLAQTLATGAWSVTTTFNSNLSGINWLAPMHDGSHQILAKTKEDANGNTTIAVFDTAAHTMVGASFVIPSSRRVIKTSKLYDPHFIVRDDSPATSSALSTVVYVQNSTIRTKTITNTIRNILSSRLSVSSNSWSMVDTDVWRIWDGFHWWNRILYDDYNIVQSGRIFQRFSLDSMAPMNKYTIPDTTQLQIGRSKILQLYPSKLGWAVQSSISDPGNAKEITRFNYSLLHGNPCQ